MDCTIKEFKFIKRTEKMLKGARFFLGSILLLPGVGMAQTAPTGEEKPKTETIYIEADFPPSPGAEDGMPTHPFFAVPSTGNEAMEKIEELEERISKLEANALLTPDGDRRIQSEGNLVIEAKGDIEIKTPGHVKFKAKSVDIPISSRSP
jgi:hypothetical protein